MYLALGVCDIRLLLRCSIDNRLIKKGLEACNSFFFFFAISYYGAHCSHVIYNGLVSHRSPASALVDVVQPTMHSVLGVCDTHLLHCCSQLLDIFVHFVVLNPRVCQ